MSLACHAVGGAILLRDGMPDPEQTAFAASLAADPDHTVVICDLAEEYPEQAWELVFQALAATAGSLRLVPWRSRPAGLLSLGELLGYRLARVVVAADGHLVMSAGGGLFVPPDAGTGWYSVGPGRLPRRDSRRFPKPKWTAWAPLEDMIALSPATMLRPLPSGAWLSAEDGALARGNRGARDHGQWLYGNVAWSHDTINVVLGQPGAPPVPAADIVKLWSTLPVKARQRVQFVPYGTSSPAAQELADALGDRVTLTAPLAAAIAPGGELDSAMKAQSAAVSPSVSRPAAASAATPAGGALPAAMITAARQPATAPARPGRQRPPSIRLESGPPGGARQRVSAESGQTTPDIATPSRVTAERREKPAAVRDEERGDEGKVSAPSPAEVAAPAVTADGVEPTAAASAVAAPADAAPGTGAVRVQPVPAQHASALYLDDALDEDRQWLQQSLSRQFSATASSVARVLSQNPRLRGGGGKEVVADLVAVRLYLTEYGQRIDDNVRTGQPGSHMPFARCVTAGLRRLPSHRGAVRLRATLSDAEWTWYGSQRLVTEWAFCPALTDGTVALPGNVDFLIWSATGRRTSALAPEVPGRVVFLPGTRFTVLAVRGGARRAVLLREMSALEVAASAPPGTEPAPHDEIALTSLEKASAAWAAMKESTELPQEYSRRFGDPPGLIRNPAGSLFT